jgi:hypothetical protein
MKVSSDVKPLLCSPFDDDVFGGHDLDSLSKALQENDPNQQYVDKDVDDDEIYTDIDMENEFSSIESDKSAYTNKASSHKHQFGGTSTSGSKKGKKSYDDNKWEEYAKMINTIKEKNKM